MINPLVMDMVDAVMDKTEGTFWDQAIETYHSGENNEPHHLLRQEPAYEALVNHIAQNEEDHDLVFTISENIHHVVETHLEDFQQSPIKERFRLFVHALLLDPRYNHSYPYVLHMIQGSEYLDVLQTEEQMERRSEASEFINYFAIEHKGVHDRTKIFGKENEGAYQRYSQEREERKQNGQYQF